jgi:hypothetical protein
MSISIPPKSGPKHWVAMAIKTDSQTNPARDE